MAIRHTPLERLVAELATRLQSPPEARSEPDFADVSAWQGLIDWEAYFAHPYRPQVAILRATLGISRVDTYWLRNARELAARGRQRKDYLVIFPDYSGRDQARFYLDTAAAAPPSSAPIVDWEVYQLGSGQTAANSLLLRRLDEALDELLRYYREPLTYSAKWFIEGWALAGTSPPVWFAETWWHLAQYLTARYEHPGPLAPVRGVPADRIAIHQTSDRLYGREFGMASEEMDYNRLLVGDLDRWFGPSPVEEPPPPAVAARLRVVRPCTFRQKPAQGSAALRAALIPVGTELELRDVAGPSAWAEIELDGQVGYAAIEHNGIRYMEIVTH